MGFQLEETHYKLDFEHPAFAGLEVTVSEVSIGELMELTELHDVIGAAKDDEKAAAFSKLIQMLGKSLVSWNLQDRNGNPVPATAEGIKSQTIKFVLVVTVAWMSAMAEVDIPLPQASNNGEIALEASIPMELSSPSPGS